MPSKRQKPPSPPTPASSGDSWGAAALQRLHRKYLANPWIPQRPHPKQALFLLHDDWFEGLYGGAAGGAKSSALLMAAAADVDTPGYSALLLRESFADLNQADALIPRSREWWSNTAARYSERDHRWTFPSGATITFGYLDRDPHVYQYQGAALQFVGVDELTQHTEFRHTYLASRIRRPSTGPLSRVPLRLRGATNPGNKGHDWVKKRYLPPEFLRSKDPARFGQPWYHQSRFFVPSRLEDNPTLDAASYESQALAQLLPVVRQQLREGDWTAHADGHFREEWFRRYDDLGDAWYLPQTRELCKHNQALIVVAVDPAGGVSESADYTAIVVVAITPGGSILVIDVIRERIPVERVVARLAEVCTRHRPAFVTIEDCFAQSAYIRQARATHGIPTVHAMDPGGNSKLVRATPAILRAEQGGIVLPRSAPWLDDFVQELASFTGDDTRDAHDDQVDALAYAVIAVDRFRGRRDDGPVILGRRGQ
jgi:predicted phage terminase large subunit-like protein